MSSSPAPSSAITLYGFSLSGHAHRVQLFLSLLGLPHEVIEVDLRARAHKTPEFLRMNPFGQVPVLRDGEVVLADSNAILVYLAGRYAPERWLPQDPLSWGRVQRWLSAAAGPLAFGPALARRAHAFKAPVNADDAPAVSAALFSVMEQELAQAPYLVGDEPSLADIALYSYTAIAPEGRIPLEPYPHIRAWLERIESLPGFVPMPRLPVAQPA